MENFKAFKLISKRIIKTLLNDFPNQSILFSDDFNKDCKEYKIDFSSCIHFLKECKVSFSSKNVFIDNFTHFAQFIISFNFNCLNFYFFMI